MIMIMMMMKKNNYDDDKKKKKKKKKKSILTQPLLPALSIHILLTFHLLLLPSLYPYSQT